MTAAVYLRKSRADEGDPDALHRHRETLLAFAQEHQMAVAEKMCIRDRSWAARAS